MARRINVCLSASGDGDSPLCLREVKMNPSIGDCTHCWSACPKTGTAGELIGRNAQNARPCSTVGAVGFDFFSLARYTCPNLPCPKGLPISKSSIDHEFKLKLPLGSTLL